MGSGHTALRPSTILSWHEKQVGVPEKPGKPAVLACGTHLAKKLFCMSGNRLGLTTQRAEPWMAIGGQPENPPKNGRPMMAGVRTGTREEELSVFGAPGPAGSDRSPAPTPGRAGAGRAVAGPP